VYILTQEIKKQLKFMKNIMINLINLVFTWLLGIYYCQAQIKIHCTVQDSGFYQQNVASPYYLVGSGIRQIDTLSSLLAKYCIIKIFTIEFTNQSRQQIILSLANWVLEETPLTTQLSNHLPNRLIFYKDSLPYRYLSNFINLNKSNHGGSGAALLKELMPYQRFKLRFLLVTSIKDSQRVFKNSFVLFHYLSKISNQQDNWLKKHPSVNFISDNIYTMPLSSTTYLGSLIHKDIRSKFIVFNYSSKDYNDKIEEFIYNHSLILYVQTPIQNNSK
jgi:hypothetical protein